MRNYRTLFGLVLIVAGVLLALQQFNYLQGNWSDALIGGLAALAAIYFLDVYRKDRAQWWFGMLAFIFLGLAINNLLDVFAPALGDAIGGVIFLAAIGIGFLIAFLHSSANWWALIPAGVMFSLASVAVFDDLGTSLPLNSGGLLFIGLGLTFLILTRVNVNGERLNWAIFPAIPLLIFGLFVGFGSASLWNYIWPSLIILFGLYFLVSAIRKR